MLLSIIYVKSYCAANEILNMHFENNLNDDSGVGNNGIFLTDNLIMARLQKNLPEPFTSV